MKKKFFTTLLVIIILSVCLYLYQMFKTTTYMMVSSPTQEECGLCGDPKGEKTYVTYKKRGNDIIDLKFDVYYLGIGSK